MIQFNSFVPVLWIDYSAIILVIAIAIGLILKFKQWFTQVPNGFFRDVNNYIGRSAIVLAVLSVLRYQVIEQKGIINDSRIRWVWHTLVFWGFIGLAIATLWDDIFFRNGVLPPPFSVANPGNIIGNVGGAMVLVGATAMLFRYLLVNKFSKTPKGDMSFFIILYLAVLSGFATEFSRFAGLNISTIAIYLIHLVIVGALLVSAPFTHFFHALLVPFERYIGRLQNELIRKKKVPTLDYRKAAMVNSAGEIKLGKDSTYPKWLQEEKESKSESKKG
jgi:hypothetical protein